MSAYFVTDENGNIREVYSNEELQESYQQVFPSVPPVDEQADYVSYHEDDVVSDSASDEVVYLLEMYLVAIMSLLFQYLLRIMMNYIN